MSLASNIGMTLIENVDVAYNVAQARVTLEQSILIGGLLIVAVMSFIYAVKAYFKIKKLKKKDVKD